ncbi:hypothetical protein [Paenibacillus sp. KN14-4R]|uniref:hypothetical protein n=1 Tax=Paenibacillus sp. KN14-4R TaxID=3445773 RepID=UPI003F9ECC48
MNDWATHYASTISLINTLGMILLTAIYVYFTIKIQKANNKVVEQNEISRKENNMPFIIVYFDMTIFNLLDMHIKNIGKNPAKKILVKLESLNDTSKVKYLERASFIDKELALLAPDQSLRTTVGSLIELENSNGDYPQYRVNIVYQDLDNNNFEQDYIIDANMYKGTVQAVVKNIHDLTKEVEKIESHLSKISNT